MNHYDTADRLTARVLKESRTEDAEGELDIDRDEPEEDEPTFEPVDWDYFLPGGEG